MATKVVHARFRLRPTPVPGQLAGAWWPESRRLSEQLAELFTLWPVQDGRVVRVLYSPPDWDDRPREVEVPGRGRVKTGNFPGDDTHKLVLSMMDGQRVSVEVIPPGASPEIAARLLDRYSDASADRAQRVNGG